jgi:hypothetical protein
MLERSLAAGTSTGHGGEGSSKESCGIRGEKSNNENKAKQKEALYSKAQINGMNKAIKI